MRFRTQSDQIQRIGITMNHIAAGCFYKSSGTSAYQSMYGRVTDVQMFGRILSDGDMKALTGCQLRKQGDLLSWDDVEWILSGGKKNIKRENLEWETIICKRSNKSYHISLAVCKETEGWKLRAITLS